MEDIILEEVRRDVFERPKPIIDLDYLYSVKRQVQAFADETNSQLKKNVYKNYSLFIESSREISTLKEEMKQLNILLDQQQTSMNKLLDQLNKTPIIQPTLERPKLESFRLELAGGASEVEAEMLPPWFIKSPEDFDVLIAQRNLREAVELAIKVKDHFEQYPKCCENTHNNLKLKIDNRIQELISTICSELQPATDRSVQGGPRSSIASIQLLRQLNLSSRAVKLYLDHRSSVLRFVLDQQKVESATTLQFIKQISSIFFHNTIETCNEFKQAFELEKSVAKALEESENKLGIQTNRGESQGQFLFDSVSPIYYSYHPTMENGSSKAISVNEISSHLLSHQMNEVIDSHLIPKTCDVFYNLATYSSLTYWTIQEMENFTILFRKHVFNNPQMTTSMASESIHHLRNQCIKMAKYCEIDLSQFVDRELENEIRDLIKDSGKKLIELINKLNAEEQWQPQQFQNKAQMTRFFEEMNDVNLRTMPSYVFEDLKLRFTSCKTQFARQFLTTVRDLSKLINSINKDYVDTVLIKVFELEMEGVVEALKKAKIASKVRFIMGNSNFLLDKVITVAESQYTSTTGMKCQKLSDLRTRYQVKVKSVASM